MLSDYNLSEDHGERIQSKDFTHKLLNLTPVHSEGINGSGTKIAIMDSIQGFNDTHEAFLVEKEGKRVCKIKCTEFRGLSCKPRYNHGTVCVGIAVGEPFTRFTRDLEGKIINSESLEYPGGVAPKAKADLFLVALGDPNAFHTALDEIIKGKYHVLSMSFGSYTEDAEAEKKLAQLKRDGTVLVAAAGNDGNAVHAS